VGSTGAWSASLTAAAGNHFGDKYNFSAPGNWQRSAAGTAPWTDTDIVPGQFATNASYPHYAYIGSYNYTNPSNATVYGFTGIKSPCLYGGFFTLAEAGTTGSCAAMVRYSGEWGYWGVTAGASGSFVYNADGSIKWSSMLAVMGFSAPYSSAVNYIVNPSPRDINVIISTDNYAFPYLGGGITGDILKWCRYNDGVSSDYEYTSCTSRKPHEPLKLMVKELVLRDTPEVYSVEQYVGLRGITYTLNRHSYVAPNTLDEDGTPELHTHLTKKKVDLVLRTTGGPSGPAGWAYPYYFGYPMNPLYSGFQHPRIILDDYNPSTEYILDGGRYWGIYSYNESWGIETTRGFGVPLTRLVPDVHYKVGSVLFKNIQTAEVAGFPQNINSPDLHNNIDQFRVYSPTTFRDCAIGRAVTSYAGRLFNVRTNQEGYAESNLQTTAYAYQSPMINFYGCTFDIATRNKNMGIYSQFFPSYTGVTVSTLASWGNTGYWGNLTVSMAPRIGQEFIERDASEGSLRKSTVVGEYNPFSLPALYIHKFGITCGEYTLGVTEMRNQYFSINLGEEGTTRATKMNHLTIGGAGYQAYVIPDSIITSDPQYVPGSYWQELNYIPTRVKVNGTINANYCNITDFCELVASPTLNSNDNAGVTSDIRIGEVRLFNFGTLNQSYNPQFINWRIGSVTGGSSAAAGTVLGGIRFLDETGIVRSSGRLWNTQLYNGYNARQSSSGKTPPSEPELGLP
jgi:hypothetical protein